MPPQESRPSAKKRNTEDETNNGSVCSSLFGFDLTASIPRGYGTSLSVPSLPWNSENSWEMRHGKERRLQGPLQASACKENQHSTISAGRWPEQWPAIPIPVPILGPEEQQEKIILCPEFQDHRQSAWTQFLRPAFCCCVKTRNLLWLCKAGHLESRLSGSEKPVSGLARPGRRRTLKLGHRNPAT